MTNDEALGSLAVPFSISYNGDTCEAAGVVEVRAVLSDGEYEATVDCELGEIVFEDVVVGPYSLTLYGMNDEGVPIVDSLGSGLIEVEVQGDGNLEPQKHIVLTEAAVTILLRWNLGYGNCKSREIKNFEVDVLKSESETTIMLSSIACRTAGVGEDEYRIVPDRRRELVGPVFDRIIVKPLDRHGNVLGEEFEVSYEDIEYPGPGDTVPLSIRCGLMGCWEPGHECAPIEE
ncbi:MAG: hypothetical protein GY854_06310 [Deltaproteobacteria bacterium]|nr:hypothetical protein [Deltaproteobacteria bacterium]